MRASQESVSLAQAMWRGFRMRCPHCGQGTLFGRFLKVAGHCPKCDEELFHHCADDFPAYLYMPTWLGWGQAFRRAGPYGGFLGKKYDALTTECEPFWADESDDGGACDAAVQRSHRRSAMAAWNAWIRHLETQAPGPRPIQSFI